MKFAILSVINTDIVCVHFCRFLEHLLYEEGYKHKISHALYFRVKYSCQRAFQYCDILQQC